MRNRLRSLLISAAIVVTAAATLLAHHSVPGQFDISKPVTLKGVISKVDWINPHIYVHLDVKEPDGTTNTWALATLPTAMMRRAGITNGSKHLAWINKITYADGHSFAPTGQ
jgi:hypothetical protein